MTNLEDLQGTYSDIYKDVYGVRPRHDTDADWSSESFLQGAIDRLVVQLGEVMVEEKRTQDSSVARFEEQMALWTAAGGGDRSAALRWAHGAEGTAGDVFKYECLRLHFVNYAQVFPDQITSWIVKALASPKYRKCLARRSANYQINWMLNQTRRPQQR